jgi:hypothetical protein
MDEERSRLRALLTRKMVHPAPDEVEAWLEVAGWSAESGPEDQALARWVEKFGPALQAAGLTAEDAGKLYLRLGPQVAASLSRLIDQGRMADLNIRYVHLWAASGLLKPSVTPGSRPGRRGTVSFTTWINEARRYITACGGDQHLAAAAAAAGFSVEETALNYAAGDLDVKALEMLTALRDSFPEGRNPS